MAGKVDGFVTPGSGRGLLDVYRDRFLLKLLVRKEIKIRYRGSVLTSLRLAFSSTSSAERRITRSTCSPA